MSFVQKKNYSSICDCYYIPEINLRYFPYSLHSLSNRMASVHGEEWPGMTRLAASPSDSLHIFQSMVNIKNIFDRKIVLLATATITDENIFNNGLFQNVFFLLRMFEAMGLLPILVVNEKPKSLEKIPEVLRSCRVICVEDLVRQPIPVAAYIEIGMSIDQMMRKYLKMIGSKVYKLYLGNILNIDVETPIFYPHMNFAHHVIGEIHDIWVSPHYGQHTQYASQLNHVDPLSPATKIAPYVWDSAVLTDDGKRHIQWRPRRADEEEVFVIMEPNISFQKTALIPLMILETWFRKHPDWKGKVVLINGDRIIQIPFFKNVIYEQLDLVKANRIQITGRLDIVTVLKTFPNATFLCHQVNNEFNYMVLELLWSGFPVLHNSRAWAEFGYYYQASDIQEGASIIEEVRTKHQDRIEAYKSHAKTLAWKHSPYNPDVHRAWKDLLAI